MKPATQRHWWTQERWWTEGRADAVVDLLGLGYLRNARAEDVARELGIPHSELVAAVRRHPERKRRGPGPLRYRERPANIPADCKWCPRCGEVKPLDDFGSNRSEKDGKQCYCRPCWNGYNKEQYQSHRKVVEQRRKLSVGKR